jgi:O-antigen/teichoic acid export membrane protein
LDITLCKIPLPPAPANTARRPPRILSPGYEHQVSEQSDRTGNPDFARHAAKGVAWTMLETWGQQALQLLFFVVLSRLVGPEGYGILGLALVVNVVGEVLITNGGWGDAVTRQSDPSPALLDSVFWTTMGLAAGLVALATVLALPAARFFGIPELALALPCMSLALPGSAAAVVPMALLRRQLRMAPMALRTLASLAVAGLVGVVMAASGAGVWSLIAFQVLQSLIGAVLIWPTTPFRPRLRFDRSALATVTRFVGGATSERVIYMVDALMPRLILGKLLGPVELGYYVLAAKVVELLSLVVQRPIQRILLPSVAHLASDAGRLGAAVRTTTRFASLMTVPAALGLAVTAPGLVPLLFGQAWLPAVPALQLMAGLVVILPINQISISVDYARGISAPQAWFALMSCILFLILVLLLRPLSLETVALALLLRGIVMVVARAARTLRTCLIRPLPFLWELAPTLAAAVLATAAAVLAAAALPAGTAPPVLVASQIAAGVLAYLAALLLLARSSLQLVMAAVKSGNQAAPSASRK